MASAFGVAPEPLRGEPHLLRGPDVVVEALRHVEHALARQLHALEGEVEVRGGGLVRPRLLGCDDPVESDAEPPCGRLEQIVVDVGDDREPAAGVERFERGRRIGESRPVADRLREFATLLRGWNEAGALPDAFEHRAENGLVIAIRRPLRLGLEGSEHLERGLARDRGTVALEHRPQRIPDAGLPVDQRAVAVEGQRLEA